MVTVDKEALLNLLMLKRRELLYRCSGLIHDEASKAEANAARGAHREINRLVKILREESLDAETARLEQFLVDKL